MALVNAFIALPLILKVVGGVLLLALVIKLGDAAESLE